ncbi:Trimethylamine corrinoid protein 2 [Desulfamplus magnetovallimortis]|uniref:Trimethylamine corrinoid protein 2 n=1 Tax=Desulfamplus magnetovallimortis TaxID=1246637 RepID=A0A1W1HAV2_9BACT|nr:corrinoid protein [Desulfamplus magnetovallimortis]SLM29610.1 Trimethylamine corrinoid protein 2 [Desulfamplus magnetovallimortis]
MKTEIFEKAMESILKGDAALAEETAKMGLGEGIDPIELINKGFIPGINKVGDLFGMGTLFLPELIQAANAMQGATDIINSAIPENSAQARGRVVIGTVAGDVHDIGKTIVVSLFKANGFEIKDLGRDVSVETFLKEADLFNADIIGTSALLTTTMPEQKKLEDALIEAGLKGKFKTMVGGAPVTRRWAKRIGADAFAENAGDGVRLARELLAK